jgi:hypothetical protein
LSARHKMHIAVANGMLIIAAIAGFAFRSWTVFALVATMLAIGAVHSGQLRLRSRHANRHVRRVSSAPGLLIGRRCGRA